MLFALIIAQGFLPRICVYCRGIWLGNFLLQSYQRKAGICRFDPAPEGKLSHATHRLRRLAAASVGSNRPADYSDTGRQFPRLEESGGNLADSVQPAFHLSLRIVRDEGSPDPDSGHDAGFQGGIPEGPVSGVRRHYDPQLRAFAQ